MKRLFLLCAVVFAVVFSWCGSSLASEPKPVYGPEVFERTVGGPDDFSASFDACDPAGTFSIAVDNGDADGKGRVSSATVLVNGLPVVTQSDFSQKAVRIEKPLTGVAAHNTVEVRMQSAPGSRISVTVSGVMRCLEVHIDSPADGDTLSDYGTIVTGSIEAQDGSEVGVVVNGVPAEVCGKKFAVAGVPLVEGEDTITATVTDDSGNTATDSIEVSLVNPETPQLYFSAYPASGQAPLEVKFDASDTIMKAVTECTLDYEGDGTVEVSAQNMDDLVSTNAHSYLSEGLYFPTLTVRDADGNVFSKKIVVNVFPMPDLKKKWDSMKAALDAGDVDTASGYFSLGTRDAYRKTFAMLKDAGALADAVSRMGDMVIVKTLGNAAEGDMRVMQDGKEYSFYVLFVKDEDGVWRIRSF